MRAARWSTVVVAVLLLAGCGQTHRQTPVSTLHLTAKDSGTELTLKPHEAFDVTLASNRSTGYRWVVGPTSQAMLGASLVSHRYIAPKQSVPGAAGKEVWHFRVVGRGGMDLEFLYVRPSPRNDPPARSVDFSINVR